MMDLILYIAVPAGVFLIILSSVLIAMCIHGFPPWCPCGRNAADKDVEKGLAKKKTPAKKPAAAKKKTPGKAKAAKKAKDEKKTMAAKNEKPAKKGKEEKPAKKGKEEKNTKKVKEEKPAKKGKEDKTAKKAKEDKTAKKVKEDKNKKDNKDKKDKKDKTDKKNKEKGDKKADKNKTVAAGKGKVSPTKDMGSKPTDKKTGTARAKVMAVVAFKNKSKAPGAGTTNTAKIGMKTSGMGMASVA